jgi:flagellar protein FliO/FliZ
MNRNAKKALIGALVIIFMSTIMVLTGMGGDRAKSAFPVSETSGVNEAESSPHGPMPLTDSGSMVWPMVKLVLALGIVVAAIYGFLYLLRKMMGQRFSGNRSNRLVEVIETTYIAQKKSVSVLRFHDRAILVGICDGSIQRLAELGPAESAAIISDFASPNPSGKFAGVLSEARTRLKSWNMNRMLTKSAARDMESPQAI